MPVKPVARMMSEVKTKLLNLSLTSQYSVEIYPPPPSLISRAFGFTENKPNLNAFDQDVLNLACFEAALPGSSLLTHEAKDDYVGVTEKIAYRKSFDDTASFSFYVNVNHENIFFFEDWIRFISGEPLIRDPVISSYGPNIRSDFVHRMRFRSEYVSPAIIINKFEKDYEKKGVYTEYRFVDAYPTSINSIPVSYESSQLLKVTVNFTFTRYLIRIVPYGETATIPRNDEILRGGNIRLADGRVFQTVAEGDGDINLGALDIAARLNSLAISQRGEFTGTNRRGVDDFIVN